MWSPKTGDQGFVRMMQDFVQTHFNRNASTNDFKSVVEKHMTPDMNLDGNGKMDWFFNQWVHGTEIPRYKLTYDVAPAEGDKWLVSATLEQSEVSPNFKMAVPLYVDLGGKIIRLGTVRMIGSSKPPAIRIPLPQKPARVMINANYDVLEKM
jgi:aminopeptidase N